MSSVDLSRPTRQVSSRSNRSASKSERGDPRPLFFADRAESCRWAEANIKKGQSSVEAKDVYASKV